MKIISISVIVVVALLAGAFFLGRAGQRSNSTSDTTASATTDSNGRQIVSIKAKGGYYPQVNTAKANTPTILKVTTNATFDCSSALVIPSLGYRKSLPPSGDTLIDIPAQAAGTKLQGLCAMGMYNFSIQFN
jgi:plastocyanin domain-containing protein